MTEVQHIDALLTSVLAHYSVDRREVRIVRAPYRIRPLGAHIDHQLGRVTAMAIDRAVYLAYAPTDAVEVRLRSMDFSGEVRIDFANLPTGTPGGWGDYARGAAAALQGRYELSRGIVGVTTGSLAEGGLSSSAAVGVAYLLALEEANGLVVAPWENVELDRQIENDHLGLRNGILDPSAILLSRRSQLTVIDCLTASHELVPGAASAPDHVWLAAFSGVRQPIVTTGYNGRVEECSEAARVLLNASGRQAVPAFLANVRAEEYAEHRDVLNGALARRARHFFTEAERVAAGIDAWRAGDLVGFGRLMSASGLSSIEDYECGSAPLIDLYETLLESEGVFGARFSGAGFRGCCIALVDAARASVIAAGVQERYALRQPALASAAPVLVCHSADGASIL